MRTFFQAKMNMAMTSCKASVSQAASFGCVFRMALSTILLVLILLLQINIIAVIITAIISILIINCELKSKGEPKSTMAIC